MLQKTYSIYSDDLNDMQLFIEAGKNHIACWCKKENEQQLRAFEFFQCDDYCTDNFEELIDKTRLYSRLLAMPVTNTNFFWSTDETLCLPTENASEDFLQSNFRLLLGETFNSKIFTAQTDKCVVAWRMQNGQQEKAQECFLGAVFNHQYTSFFQSLKLVNVTGAYLFFYPGYFTLILINNSTLSFAQTRKYNTPEDVLYFVLNVFKQYNLEKDSPVFCGGFIDEKSKLFDALHQYIEGFQLMYADDASFSGSEFKEYSTHYFAPYINYLV